MQHATFTKVKVNKLNGESIVFGDEEKEKNHSHMVKGVSTKF
jgi:hypothetical protein